MAESPNVTLHKEPATQYQPLHTRQNRRKGKPVALKGNFVLSTSGVLEITRDGGEFGEKKASPAMAIVANQRRIPGWIPDICDGVERSGL